MRGVPTPKFQNVYKLENLLHGWLAVRLYGGWNLFSIPLHINVSCEIWWLSWPESHGPMKCEISGGRLVEWVDWKLQWILEDKGDLLTPCHMPLQFFCSPRRAWDRTPCVSHSRGWHRGRIYGIVQAVGESLLRLKEGRGTVLCWGRREK